MACNNDMGVTQPANNGKITLAIDASGASFTTRATVANNEAESKLEWIDVFIFNATDKSIFHHERINHSSASEPHTLALALTEDLKGKSFYVDVIANSQTLKAINDVKATITTRDALYSQIETTEYIQMTGSNLENTPTSFLMDGVAYMGSSEPSTPAAITLVASDGDLTQNVAMNVTLRRAAAKIVFNFKIKDGGNYTSFGIKDGDTYTPAGSYFIDNMKYKAMLTAEAENEKAWTNDYLRTTTEIPYGDYLKGNPATEGAAFTTVQLTTYVYCHKWDYKQNSSSSLSEIEPSVIVNLPMVDNAGNNHERNYYEIALDVVPTVDSSDVDHFALERNHYYAINATINALGGSSPQTRVELEDVKYEAHPWDETVINVGGQGDAAYLTLNTYHFEMHNESVDDYTLMFASSSEIKSISLEEAYYYNKYGNRIDLANGDSTDKGVRGNINATAVAGLNGNITVNSPLQHNGADAHKNTIRYLTFKVTNEQNLTKTFTVMQYPLIYITNQQGWYSYRSDFIASGQTEPTTYENISSTNNIVAIRNNGTSFTYSSSNSTSGTNASYWVSKVDTKYSSSYYAGESAIHSYYWSSSMYGGGSRRTSSSTPGFNARMYHIRVTATSDEYTLGTPRITDGVTDSGEDNAKLVSPSFMIASQLGVVQMNNIKYSNRNNSSSYLAEMKVIFGEHCKNYVETYTRRKSNGETETIHLDDWRLPTESELNIIMSLQGKSGDNNTAIDYLINAGFYYTATGPKYNNNHAHGGMVNASTNPTSYTAVRCVRDAFDSKTPPVITNTSSAQTE